MLGGRGLCQTFDSWWLQWILGGGGVCALRCKKPNAKCVKAGESGSLATVPALHLHPPPETHFQDGAKNGSMYMEDIFSNHLKGAANLPLTVTFAG